MSIHSTPYSFYTATAGICSSITRKIKWSLLDSIKNNIIQKLNIPHFLWFFITFSVIMSIMSIISSSYKQKFCCTNLIIKKGTDMCNPTDFPAYIWTFWEQSLAVILLPRNLYVVMLELRRWCRGSQKQVVINGHTGLNRIIQVNRAF